MDSLTLIPLRQLRLSPLNVRQKSPDGVDEEMADSLAEKGLLQNLVVHHDENDIDLALVCAGGRRLRGLLINRDRGLIDDEFAVPVRICALGDAREISLMENIGSHSLTPVEEYRGFAQIVSDHASEPDPVGICARRLGVPRLRVERALRLASLAPEILAALEYETIGVEAARAYASITDHATQLLVFNAEERRTMGTKHRPLEIRMALSTKTYSVLSLKPRYVGLAAFRAAGGEVDHDLFVDSDRGGVISQTALLDTLALQKAEQELPALVDKHGFREGLLSPALAAYASWPPAPRGWLQVQHRRSLAEAPKKGRGRIDLIGIYALADDGAGGPPELTCIGWYPKRDIPAEGGLAPPAPPTVLPSLDRRPADRAPQPMPIVAGFQAAAETRRQLAAAHLAIQPLVAETSLGDHAYWPQPHDMVPAIAPGPDEDTLVVALLVHVRKSELEALLPAATEQIDIEDEANDYVAAAEAELVPISGGGRVKSLLSSK